jgi:hypothetical protein
MKNYIYYLILSILVFTACKKNANDAKIVDIEKEFSVQLWEQLDENGGNLQLQLSTIQNQPCGATRIDYSQNTFNDKVIVTIKNLISPLTCNNKPEPARDTVSLGNLKKGSYKVNINLKDIVLNDGTLNVEDGKYSLSMRKEDGIAVANREILRVPQGAIWGYVAYDAGQEGKYAKFNDNLLKIVTPLLISQGDYGYFNLKSSTSLELKSPVDTKKATTKQLLYKLNATRLDLQNLIFEYRAQGLDIQIFTFDGKVL